MDLQTAQRQGDQARVVMDSLKARAISAVALTFVDNAGITRVKTVPTERLPQAAAHGVGMSPVFDFFLVDDSIAPQGTPVGDLLLIPDLARVTALSAQPRWAWAPVNRYTQDGEPHPGCQRTFAIRMARDAASRGLQVQAGFEVEWAVGSEDAEGRFVPACLGPAYGMGRLSELSDYVADLYDALTGQGVNVLQIHPEYAPGQFECSVAPADLVAAADTTVLVRETIRALTNARGMRASFAPKVVAGGVGNGCHLHLSLWREGRNLFAQGTGRHGLTGEAETFVSRVLAQLPALVAIGAPGVASYLRLVPSRWAGAYQCWGLENREAALRLVEGPATARDRSANLEIKCFDGAANPYLVVGAVLAAGLAASDGPDTLPGEVTVDPASLSDDERARLGVVRLPQDLAAAIEHLSKCEPLTAAMGPDLLEAFLAVRRAELERFSGLTDEEVVAATRWKY